jgi:hypothetical protein
MRGAIPPLPQYVFMAWCLVKHRDNFTFTFTLNVVLQKLHPILGLYLVKIMDFKRVLN